MEKETKETTIIIEDQIEDNSEEAQEEVKENPLIYSCR